MAGAGSPVRRVPAAVQDQRRSSSVTRIRGRRWVAASLAICLGVLPSLVVAADNANVDATVAVAPIVIELSLSPTQAAVGERVQARATVTNVGPSAVGPIDEEQRFYLESRGVRPEVTERLVVLGFFDEVLEQLPAGDLAAELRRSVAAKLNIGEAP